MRSYQILCGFSRSLNNSECHREGLVVRCLIWRNSAFDFHSIKICNCFLINEKKNYSLNIIFCPQKTRQKFTKIITRLHFNVNKHLNKFFFHKNNRYKKTKYNFNKIFNVKKKLAKLMKYFFIIGRKSEGGCGIKLHKSVFLTK